MSDFIKIKIALAVGSDGGWQAYGYKYDGTQENMPWDEVMEAFELLPDEQRYWIEAVVPKHGLPTIKATTSEEPQHAESPNVQR